VANILFINKDPKTIRPLQDHLTKKGHHVTVANQAGEGIKSALTTHPDVIFVGGPGALFFKKLTSRIPIVAITADPVRAGIVESLAHPGGNITGASIDAGPSIHGKRIALLREMFPAVSKLGFLALRDLRFIRILVEKPGSHSPNTRAPSVSLAR